MQWKLFGILVTIYGPLIELLEVLLAFSYVADVGHLQMLTQIYFHDIYIFFGKKFLMSFDRSLLSVESYSLIVPCSGWT